MCKQHVSLIFAGFLFLVTLHMYFAQATYIQSRQQQAESIGLSGMNDANSSDLLADGDSSDLVDSKTISIDDRAKVVYKGCDRGKDDFAFRRGNRINNFLHEPTDKILVCAPQDSGGAVLLQSMGLKYGMTLLDTKRYGEFDDHEFVRNLVAKTRVRNPQNMKSFNFTTDDSVKVFVVRHPFLRLIDTYKSLRKVMKGEFLMEALKSIVENRIEVGDEVTHKLSVKKEVTFPQFVRFLLSQHSAFRKCEKYHELWCPQTSLCGPCEVKYDYILKFESIKQDMIALRDKGVVNVISKQMNVIFKTGKKANEEWKSYFSQLRLEEAMRLYKIYRDDFKRYNYPAKPFISVAKESSKVIYIRGDNLNSGDNDDIEVKTKRSKHVTEGVDDEDEDEEKMNRRNRKERQRRNRNRDDDEEEVTKRGKEYTDGMEDEDNKDRKHRRKHEKDLDDDEDDEKDTAEDAKEEEEEERELRNRRQRSRRD